MAKQIKVYRTGIQPYIKRNEVLKLLEKAEAGHAVVSTDVTITLILKILRALVETHTNEHWPIL